MAASGFLSQTPQDANGFLSQTLHALAPVRLVYYLKCPKVRLVSLVKCSMSVVCLR